MRYIAPYLIQMFVKKAQKRMMQDMGHEPPSSGKKKEGEINVDYVPDKKKKNANKDDMGDYIDFEEIKE